MTKYSPAGVGFIDLKALISFPVYVLVLSLCATDVDRSDPKPTSNLYIRTYVNVISLMYLGVH